MEEEEPEGGRHEGGRHEGARGNVEEEEQEQKEAQGGGGGGGGDTQRPRHNLKFLTGFSVVFQYVCG